MPREEGHSACPSSPQCLHSRVGDVSTLVPQGRGTGQETVCGDVACGLGRMSLRAGTCLENRTNLAGRGMPGLGFHTTSVLWVPQSTAETGELSPSSPHSRCTEATLSCVSQAGHCGGHDYRQTHGDPAAPGRDNLCVFRMRRRKRLCVSEVVLVSFLCYHPT